MRVNILIHRSCPIALLALVAIIGLAGCGSGDSGDAGQGPVAAPERLTFGGAGDLGIFDPAVSRDPVTDRLWMSYSSVNSSVFYPPSQYWAVSIRLALSDDNSVSWQDAGCMSLSILIVTSCAERVATWWKWLGSTAQRAVINGACVAFPELDGGLLLRQFESTATEETFRIFKSLVGLP